LAVPAVDQQANATSNSFAERLLKGFRQRIMFVTFIFLENEHVMFPSFTLYTFPVSHFIAGMGTTH